MATQTVITVSGDSEAAAKLRRIGRGLISLQDPMSEIGSYLTGFFSGEVFASRGGVIGEPWPALSASYAAYKARKFPGAIPLVRTGLMNKSFKSRAGRLSVTVRNTAPYFDYHQDGTARVPARVMMKVDQVRERRVVDLIEAHIRKAVA